MATVEEVLEIDKKFRQIGVVDDLHELRKIKKGKTLDYDMPTLVSSNFDYNKSVKLCTKIEDFKKGCN